MNAKLKEGFKNEFRTVYGDIEYRQIAEYKRGVLTVESSVRQSDHPVQRSRLEIKTRGSVAEAEKINWSAWQGADEKQGLKVVCEEIPVG